MRDRKAARGKLVQTEVWEWQGMGEDQGDEAAAWLAERGLALRERGAKLGVCIMTADFWGLKSAGGTATAYHLLAQVLPCVPSICLLTHMPLYSCRHQHDVRLDLNNALADTHVMMILHSPGYSAAALGRHKGESRFAVQDESAKPEEPDLARRRC